MRKGTKEIEVFISNDGTEFLTEQECKEYEKHICKNPKCEKCGARTALVSGSFSYTPDMEPYISGVVEDAKVVDGSVDLIAYKCDKCGNIQNFEV